MELTRYPCYLVFVHMSCDALVTCAGECAQVRMLDERRGSLRRLTLRACDLTEHDPDVPLIFDLRSLAQVSDCPTAPVLKQSNRESADGCALAHALLHLKALDILRCTNLGNRCVHGRVGAHNTAQR